MTPPLVVTGPSGSGKTTVADAVAERLGLRRAVTATTRPNRPGEQDGVDYHFWNEPYFEAMVKGGHMVEHEEVYSGVFYGLPKSELTDGTAVVLDVYGANTLRDRAVVVCLVPPSADVLAERLYGRGDTPPEEAAARLLKSVSEVQFAEETGMTLVVNDDLQACVDDVVGLLSLAMV